MLRTPFPHDRGSARPAFALLSVLAVLALACFPGLAGAEENSGIQYETDVPTVPNDQSSNIPSKNSSGGSNAPSESEKEASSSESPSGGGTGGSDGSGQGGGTSGGQSSQAGGGQSSQAQNGAKDAGGVSGAQPLPTAASSAPNADDGSSPLVPILIAVAVLAAASIGYFLYRQRRPGSGSPVSSPKAG
jgi:cobalamin biosynthesis Mg chelatase CobN